MIQSGAITVATVNTAAKTNAKRSMMVTAFFRDVPSFIPQKREVRTEAPMPMPIQKIINRLMNCPARDDADSWVSPIPLSMTVSIRLMPTVIMDCREMGTAILSIFL